MKYVRIVTMIIVATVISGCGEQKIDASSEETLKSSIQKVRKALPDKDKDEFDEAVQPIN